MGITHIVRGSEYLASTPKYVHLYKAFGYDVPIFVHLPLINGPDGRKLSKRHGATSFEELVADGFLPDAIINYLALLGWSPGTNQEIFSLKELEEAFDFHGIGKAPAVFDIEKLRWFNEQYIKAMTPEEFTKTAQPYYEQIEGQPTKDMSKEQLDVLAEVLQPRTEQFTEIPEKLVFLSAVQDHDLDLYYHKRMKTDANDALKVFPGLIERLKDTPWTIDDIGDAMRGYASELGVKNGKVMWPVRVAITGMKVSPGGAVEGLFLLGKEESMKRLQGALERLEKELN